MVEKSKSRGNHTHPLTPYKVSMIIALIQEREQLSLGTKPETYDEKGVRTYFILSKLLTVLRYKVPPGLFDFQTKPVRFVFSMYGEQYAYERNISGPKDTHYARIRVATVGERKGDNLFDISFSDTEDSLPLTWMSFRLLYKVMGNLFQKSESVDRLVEIAEALGFEDKVSLVPGRAVIMEFMDKYMPLWKADENLLTSGQYSSVVKIRKELNSV